MDDTNGHTPVNKLNAASRLLLARNAPVGLPLDASAADNEAGAWLERATGGVR